MAEGKVRDSRRIGIVGGSIAGCAAAIELTRAGYQVDVYEKSSRPRTRRGVGVATPIASLQALIARDLISVETPHFLVHQQPFSGRSNAGERLGRTAWSAPVTLALVNWDDLYRQLRRRVPDDVYHEGVQVTGARNKAGGAATVQLAGGGEATYDLVVFADGYRSLGRLQLFPNTKLVYRGYLLWQGELAEVDLADSAPLEGRMPRLSLQGMAGHAVFFLVPGEDGSVEQGRRRVNWSCYIPAPVKSLSSFLTDRHGRQRTGLLPPGYVRAEVEARLKALMNQQLPAYYGEIIADSHDTLLQPVYEVELPAYHRGRICVIGDAGALAPPFTGSGVFKGTGNALDLAAALAEHDNLDAALAEWDDAQTQTGQKLVVLGRQMEKALVWRVPNFSRLDEQSAAVWWRKTVTFPDEFSYSDNDGS